MKTKNKMIALVEIAIVLCSVFLVAIPAIAGEQNSQKISASTITTASEDNYVLGIYGNANEDDTIDMRDLTYVKLIFFGKKPETELSDAKYDGKINPLDFIQIKLIIVGKEKELTVVLYTRFYGEEDFTEGPVTVPMPIERIVEITTYSAEMLCAFGEQDKIVGIVEYTKKMGELKTFIEDKPSVSEYGYTWDLEKILELNPDIVIAFAHWDFSDYAETLSTAGISVVQMDCFQAETYLREIRNLGWMLNNKERAEEIINFDQQQMNLIEERVKDLEEYQKPRVYFEYSEGIAHGPGSAAHDDLIVCGGINIFADALASYPTIDPEAVIVRNPEVILRSIWQSCVPCGYDVTDASPVEELRDDLMSRPGWDSIDAVINGKVYLISCEFMSHPGIYHSYIAKWLHPELFEDIDPVDIHREWFGKFLGLEYKGGVCLSDTELNKEGE